MNDLELNNQIKTLEREYLDLRNAINSLSGNLNNTAILRGTLSGAGASAESILKCIIRKEKINIKTNDPKIPNERADELRKKEVQGLMLDELIKLVESKIPLNILTHLRTIQAWRNIGSHDKGEHAINETVNSSTLQVVSLALSELVLWFIGSYLNFDTSSFIFQETIKIEDKYVSPIQIWTEEYWHSMRKGSLTALDEAKLSKIAKQYNILSEEIFKIKSNFLRRDEYLYQILKEAFEDDNIDIEELEAIEHSRFECHISLKETKEMLNNFNWKLKFKDAPKKLLVEWMKDELVSEESISDIQPINNNANSIKSNNIDRPSIDNSLDNIDKKAFIYKLKDLIEKSNNKITPEKIWVYKGCVLVFDFIIFNEYKISVDTILFDEGWEIQIFGRNNKSKNYLFETMCKTVGFLPMSIDKYDINDRLLYKEIIPVNEIEKIKESLTEHLIGIQNYESISALTKS
jgi:hypothetical protein